MKMTAALSTPSGGLEGTGPTMASVVDCDQCGGCFPARSRQHAEAIAQVHAALHLYQMRVAAPRATC